VLGFGGGGMARLEIASASGGDSGASGSECELFEASRGRCSEWLFMAGSLSCEDAMSGNVESEVER
jgi:hypothetical protein